MHCVTAAEHLALQIDQSALATECQEDWIF